MAYGLFADVDFLNLMFPIIGIIPPTRWERFKAWVRGEQAKSLVIRRVW